MSGLVTRQELVSIIRQVIPNGVYSGVNRVFEAFDSFQGGNLMKAPNSLSRGSPVSLSIPLSLASDHDVWFRQDAELSDLRRAKYEKDSDSSDTSA